MLDVHAPHGATHGWRDFLVHIAAIAIGLLLALGLEKLAEYVHERRLLTQARRELVAEVAENRHVLSLNVTEASRVKRALDADLKAIQAVRSHATGDRSKLDYSAHFYAVKNGAWEAVRQGGSLDLMPHEELQNYAWFHGILASLMESMHAFETTALISDAIGASSSLDKLAPRDLDELASRTMEAQGRLEHLRMFLELEGPGLDLLETMGKRQAR